MDAGRVGNLPDDLPGLRVRHHDLRGVAHVDAMGGRIDGDVVPSTGAPDLNLLDDLIRRIRGFSRTHGRNRHRHEHPQCLLPHDPNSFQVSVATCGTPNKALGLPAA